MQHGGAEKHEDVIKEIENGYKTLSESIKQWESLCKGTEKTVASYNYLHDQITQSKRFQEDAEICTFFPDLKINLLSTIHDKMNEEMDRLSITLCDCKKIVDTLKSKHEKATAKQMSKKDESKAATRGLKSLDDAIKCLSSAYLRMSCAFHKARALEDPIPQTAFSFTVEQQQTIGRCIEIWQFYTS